MSLPENPGPVSCHSCGHRRKENREWKIVQGAISCRAARSHRSHAEIAWIVALVRIVLGGQLTLLQILKRFYQLKSDGCLQISHLTIVSLERIKADFEVCNSLFILLLLECMSGHVIRSQTRAKVISLQLPRVDRVSYFDSFLYECMTISL